MGTTGPVFSFFWTGPSKRENMAETFGQKVLKNREKNPVLLDDPREYRKAMEPQQVDELHALVAEALQSVNYQNKDFYIQQFAKAEPITKQPYIRNYARQTCPFPACGEALWKYHHESGYLEFMWQIPGLPLYLAIIKNPKPYLEDKRYDLLAKAAVLMAKGELHKITRMENDYKQDGIILLNKDTNG